MKLSQLMEIITKVLVNPMTIGVTVVIFLYMSLVNYVVYYRKKPPKKRVRRPSPSAKKEEASESEDDGED